jgi:hypothetical protein
MKTFNKNMCIKLAKYFTSQRGLSALFILGWFKKKVISAMSHAFTEIYKRDTVNLYTQ